MKLKLTLIAVAAISAFSGSVQAQTSTSKTEQQVMLQFHRTGILTAWQRGFTGQGVRVAVLDSGFDLTHTDLRGQVAAAKNFNPASLTQIASNTNNIRSQVQAGTDITWGYHGTMMASIVGGRLDNNGTVGVAYNSQLLLAQIGEGVRYNTTTKAWAYSDAGISMSAVYSALTWAEANRAVAANMSFGSTFDKTFQGGVKLISPGLYQAPSTYNRASATNPCFASMYGNCLSDLNAFANASKTIVLVAAAGNQGLPYAQFPGAFATQVDKNGNLVLGGRMLIVGSVNSKNVISTFSNRAGSFCNNLTGTVCNDKYYVKDFFVVAPGEAIIASQPNQIKTGNVTFPSTGTSPATAYVTGGIAVLKQAWPQLTAAQLVQLVKTTATDLGAPGVDEVYGWGLVNFDKASQPQSDVKYTKLSLTAGPAVAGTAITTTGLTVTNPALKVSNVLQNVQVVDGLNRNYTADFTRTIGTSSPANSLYTSPYLAMQSAGYRETTVPVGSTDSFTVMQSNSGSAVAYDSQYGTGRVNFQFGSMMEQNGFLNNSGTGLFATGASQTAYAVIGGSYPVAESVDIVGNYGVGYTKTSNVADSFLAVGPKLISNTWKLGIAKKEIFFTGKSKDQLTLSVHGPVTIRRGYADVTAVTGYNYNGSEDAVVATPIMSTERVNLAQGQRQTDMILGYSVSINNRAYAGINVARQFNVGGVSGQTGNAVGVMIRNVF